MVAPLVYNKRIKDSHVEVTRLGTCLYVLDYDGDLEENLLSSKVLTRNLY